MTCNTWILPQYWAPQYWAPHSAGGSPGLAPSVPPLCVEDVTGDKSDDEIKYGDDCTEFCGSVFTQPKGTSMQDLVKLLTMRDHS